MDLDEFLFQQADEFVVLFDGFEGLDEDRLAAGAGAVNYALHAAFLLDFDGDDEAFAADGDEFVLHGAALGQAAQIAAQGFLNRAALLFDFAADAASSGEALSSSVPSGWILLRKPRRNSVKSTIWFESARTPRQSDFMLAGGCRTISRHSAARSTTRITSRISVVSRAAPAMRDSFDQTDRCR